MSNNKSVFGSSDNLIAGLIYRLGPNANGPALGEKKGSGEPNKIKLGKKLKRADLEEIAELTPTFTGVSFKKLDELGSVQWPCNESAPLGTPIMHVDEFVRGKGQFMITDYVPTTEVANRKFPLLLTTGRNLVQYNVGTQTRRTHNNLWANEDVLEIHPADASARGIDSNSLVLLRSRKGETTLKAIVTEIQEMINQHPKTNQEGKVRFQEFGSSSLDILVMYFVDSPKWNDLIDVKEDVNYKIMEIVKKHNSDFAFPSTTVYLQK